MGAKCEGQDPETLIRRAVSDTYQHVRGAGAHQVLCRDYTRVRVISNEGAFPEVAGRTSSSVSMREHGCEPGNTAR